MGDSVEWVSELLSGFDDSPEGSAVSLRQDLSSLICRALHDQGLTQRDLARKCGKRESYISRLIHDRANCTIDVMARVLHGLGVRPRLMSETDVALGPGITEGSVCVSEVRFVARNIGISGSDQSREKEQMKFSWGKPDTGQGVDPDDRWERWPFAGGDSPERDWSTASVAHLVSQDSERFDV